VREVHVESESVSGNIFMHSQKLCAYNMPLFAWKHEEFSSKDKVSDTTNFWSYHYSKGKREKSATES